MYSVRYFVKITSIFSQFNSTTNTVVLLGMVCFFCHNTYFIIAIVHVYL